jgi:LDH2 family malate/lactate/ureidoglycolate dehydrogenase
MLRVNAELLREQTVAILRGWGMSAEHADITAARLAHADVRGIDSHGVALLLLYAEHQAKDWINFTPDITVLRETPVITLLDGDHGLGHVPSTLAMQSAIDKCRVSGLAASAVRHSNHYGAAGAYSLLAAEAGFIGMSTTTTPGVTVAALAVHMLLALDARASRCGASRAAVATATSSDPVNPSARSVGTWGRSCGGSHPCAMPSRASDAAFSKPWSAASRGRDTEPWFDVLATFPRESPA